MKSKAGNQYYFTDEKRCESCGMIQDNCMCYKEKQLTRYCKAQGQLRITTEIFRFVLEA